MSKTDRAVAYWRMSSNPQEKSIPQQRAEMTPRCRLEGVEIVQEFKDEGISGGGMKKRDDFQDMLRFCQQQAKAGQPIQAIVCYDPARFSRADSNETGHYIWEFRRAGVNRLLTWERWFDFRKEEDRAIFNIQQDFTNNRYLRDLSARVLRGKKSVAAAGYFTGGAVPYAFDRVLLDEQGKVVNRIHRGEKVRLRKQGWRLVLAPFPEDDPDPARQLERQTALWLYQTFAAQIISYRNLAEQLNKRGVPGPGGGFWVPQTITGILTNPVYAGTGRLGKTGKGQYHRLVSGEIRPVEPGTRQDVNAQGLILTDLEHGGIIDRETWQCVQEKAQERARLSLKPRSGGYVLPGGVLHCGHCGGKMYGTTMRPRSKGGRVYEYRKYTCASPNTKPGTCRYYAVLEDTILDQLLDQLLQVYLAPERLESVRQKLLDKTEAKHQKAPAAVERLERRLAELDGEIRDAARNVLRAKDNVDLLNEALTELRKVRARVAKDLAAAQKACQTPMDDTQAQAEAAIGRLFSLREQLEEARRTDNRPLLGECIRLLVSRVDVYFEQVQKGKKEWSRFSKGVIKLRPLLRVQGNGTSGR
jgi:DNA invertase Pin-like site-specific DNA recombinase